jgi:uncharacterized coiled-coil protein SlyX
MADQIRASLLEEKIARLERHITEQDGEMFRMSKAIDKLAKRCEKLEGRLADEGGASPVDPSRTPQDEVPPHY